MKRIILCLFLAFFIAVGLRAEGYGNMFRQQTHRFAAAVHMGGLATKGMEVFNVGAYVNVYGVCASISCGLYDNWKPVYPLCGQYQRDLPRLHEFLVGYSLPVWQNFESEYKQGYALYLSPVGGWFLKDYANVSYHERYTHQQVTERFVRKYSYGVILTLKSYSGFLINVKATQWGGEIGLGYSFFSPYRRK